MNICLIGNGLASLALAKNLINKKIKVFVYYENTKKLKFQSRTIGISKNNFNFFDKDIIKFKRNMFWKIKQIEIYLEKYNDEKILNFEKSKEELFSIVKNASVSNLENHWSHVHIGLNPMNEMIQLGPIIVGACGKYG